MAQNHPVELFFTAILFQTSRTHHWLLLDSFLADGADQQSENLTAIQTAKQMQLHGMNQGTRGRTDEYYSRKADSRQRFFGYVATHDARASPDAATRKGEKGLIHLCQRIR